MIQGTEDGSTTNGFLERHRSASIAAFVALLVLLALSCLCLQVTGGLGPVPYATPAFSIEELLLDESAFPEGWRSLAPSDPDRRIPAEQLGRHLLPNTCHPLMVGATHDVYRLYGGASSAAEEYPEELGFWFSSNWGDWGVPPELSYASAVADQYRFGCYLDEDFHNIHCRGLGQYEEYIVVFSAKLDPDHPECLSYNDLERVLVAIDERMAFYLGKDMR